MNPHAYARCGDRDSLLALLNAGCDVDAKDNWDMTPLMYAANGGYTECAQLLLERGADASSPDEDQLTATHYAIVSGYLEILRLLLASAADPVTLGPLFIILPFIGSNAVSFALACGCPLKAPSDAIEAAKASVLRPIICGYYSLPHLL